MSKEQESFNRIKLFIDYMNDEFDSEDVSAVDNALERLGQIDNADPGKAMDCLEYICKTLKEAIKIDVKWLFKGHYTTIICALLKAQEQEKEKLFFKNIHNTKVKTPLVSIFEGLSQDERHKFTEHLYYHWEEMKEALEEQNKQLVEENIELKKKLNKHYLKWDDLEFRNEEQTMKVKMGDTHYLLTLRIGLTDVKSVVLRDNNLKPFLHLFEKEKQFFNDLHLERVEE